MEHKTPRSQSEEQLRNIEGLKSAMKHHHSNATDRERCEGERQGGRDIDRRSVARVVIAREPELSRTTLREPWATRNTHRLARVSYSVCYFFFLENDFPRQSTK